MIDRLTIRKRPPGRPIMHQTWDNLLFLHWPVEMRQLRHHVPSELQVDTFDGAAWVGVTPFSMRNVRPRAIPPIPLISTTNELNVRTYVHHEGVPGIWFFSLDASNPIMVLGARLFFSLPYFPALMSLRRDGSKYDFRSTRLTTSSRPLRLWASWMRTNELPPLEAGSLKFFLIERYCLYVMRNNRLRRARIFHRPWPLASANELAYETNILEASGLLPAQVAPLAHCQSAPLHVDVWPLKPVSHHL